MSRLHPSRISSLALAFALAAGNYPGTVLAQEVPKSRSDLPEAVQERFDQLVQACRSGIELPPALAGGLECSQLIALAEASGGGAPVEAEAEASEGGDTAARDGEAAPDPAAETNLQSEAEAARAAAETERQQAEERRRASEAEAAAASESDARAEERRQREQQRAEEQQNRERDRAAEKEERERAREQEQQERERQRAADEQERQREQERQQQAEQDRALEREAEEARREARIEAERAAQRRANEEAAGASAAANADPGAGGAEVTEEEVGADEVRRSSEDFRTGVDALLGENRPRTRNDDDDGDSRNRIRDAALLGLGAIALNELLRGDERIISNSGDRAVIEDNGQLRVLRNDDVLLRRPGADVQTYSYDDGSTRQIVTYEDGSVVDTVRTAQGRVLRRTRILPDGTEVVLFDDTTASEEVEVSELPQFAERRRIDFDSVDADDLAAALAAQDGDRINRTFSLNQIRSIDAVRTLVPEISVDTINFETGSAAIRPDEAEELAALGRAMVRAIERNPGEVFLIEGHTDAVGAASYNLALSDRRAESVALALTEYFDVPPENMVLQGYGESDLLVPTEEGERRNRRAAVRLITPLLR